MVKISTSILSASDRIVAINELNNTTSDYIHIDVMDGKFVTNKQFSIKEIININMVSTKKLDVHLMVSNPIKYIKKLANLNIDCITFHYEISKNKLKIIKLIRKLGYRVGISIKPNTKVEDLGKYLDLVDLVLIMSVEPGYGAQEFMTTSLDKVREIKNINNNITVEIDGGINDSNIKDVVQSGADMIVVGSYITNSTNYQDQISKLFFQL